MARENADAFIGDVTWGENSGYVDAELCQAISEEIVGFGTIVRYLPEGPSVWSAGVYRILGVEPGEIEASPEGYAEFLCEDDRAASRAEYDAILRERRSGGGVRRIRRRDGVLRWVQASARVLDGADGEARAVLILLRDVTEEHETRNEFAASEARLRAAQGIANIGSWSLDVQTGANTWSDELYRICGLERGATAPTLDWFIDEVVHPEDQEIFRNARRNIFVEGVQEIDYRIRRGDDQVRVLRSRVNAMKSPGGLVVRVMGVTQDVTDMLATQEALRGYQARLRELADAVSSAAERERRRLGAELHDGAVQGLGFLRMKLAELRTHPAPRRTAVLFDEMFAVLDDSIRQSRALLQELSPQVLYELGFEAAIDWLAEQTRVRHRIECDVRITFNTGNLAEEVSVQLYQAVRELLTNVFKHSGAKRATVAIESSAGMLRVSVSDDGIGCEPYSDEAPVGKIGGFGLFSIRERLRLLGGSMTVTPTADSGTCVTLMLPLTESTTQRPERR